MNECRGVVGYTTNIQPHLALREIIILDYNRAGCVRGCARNGFTTRCFCCICFMPTHVLTLDFRIMRNKVGSVQMFHKAGGFIWPAMNEIGYSLVSGDTIYVGIEWVQTSVMQLWES